MAVPVWLVPFPGSFTLVSCFLSHRLLYIYSRTSCGTSFRYSLFSVSSSSSCSKDTSLLPLISFSCHFLLVSNLTCIAESFMILTPPSCSHIHLWFQVVFFSGNPHTQSPAKQISSAVIAGINFHRFFRSRADSKQFPTPHPSFWINRQLKSSADQNTLQFLRFIRNEGEASSRLMFSPKNQKSLRHWERNDFLDYPHTAFALPHQGL